MVARFIKIRTSVRKAMINFDIDVSSEPSELIMVEDLVAVLSPVKDAIKRMSVPGATVLTGE